MVYAAAERLVLAAGGDLVESSRYKDANLCRDGSGATHVVADAPKNAWPQASKGVMAQSAEAKIVSTAWLIDRLEGQGDHA